MRRRHGIHPQRRPPQTSEALGNGFVLIMKEPEVGGPTEPVKRLGESFQKSFRKILIILQQKPETTIAEISALLGITDKAVKKNLTTLKKTGAIKRIGPAKGGR